jgi:hypothetical protein
MGEHIFKQEGAFAMMLEDLALVPLDEILEQNLLVGGWQNSQFSLQLSQTLPSTETSQHPSKRPLSISIAHSSDDAKLLPKIVQLLVTLQEQGNEIGWQPNEIHFNRQWENKKEDYLGEVDLLLLLVTPSFISCKYCYCEHLKWAINQHDKKAYIVPILLRDCLWDETPFATLPTITPSSRKAVDEWSKPNQAFKQIGLDIRAAIKHLQARR